MQIAFFYWQTHLKDSLVRIRSFQRLSLLYTPLGVVWCNRTGRSKQALHQLFNKCRSQIFCFRFVYVY